MSEAKLAKKQSQSDAEKEYLIDKCKYQEQMIETSRIKAAEYIEEIWYGSLLYVHR